MTVEFIDKSGQPRSDEEVKEAIKEIEKALIRADTSNIPLFLQFPIIRQSLQELLQLRSLTRRAMEELKESSQ